MYRGARIAPTGIQNYTTISVFDALRFAVAQYDTNGLWSAANPNRLTIPEGVSKVRLRLSANVDPSDQIPLTNLFSFRKNGSNILFDGSVRTVVNASGYTNPGIGLVSDIIDVVPGDYFEAVYSVLQTFSLNPALTWFSVEIVEITDAAAFRTRDLLDVVTAAPSDGQVLVYNAALGKYVPGKPSVTVPEGASIYKPFRGALVKRTADTTTINGNYSNVIWQAAEYDTDLFWSAGAPSRLTVPTGKGIKRVRLVAGIETSGITGNMLCRILKKGSSAFIGTINMGSALGTTGFNNTPFSAMTSVINVVDGDYFEVLCSTSATAWKAMSARSSFAIEVVEAEEPIP